MHHLHQTAVFVWPEGTPLPEALAHRLSSDGVFFRTRDDLDLEVAVLALHRALGRLLELGVNPQSIRAFCCDQLDPVIATLDEHRSANTDGAAESSGHSH